MYGGVGGAEPQGSPLSRFHVVEALSRSQGTKLGVCVSGTAQQRSLGEAIESPSESTLVTFGGLELEGWVEPLPLMFRELLSTRPCKRQWSRPNYSGARPMIPHGILFQTHHSLLFG